MPLVCLFNYDYYFNDMLGHSAW